MTTKEKSKWNNRTQCSAIYCKNYQCNTTDLAFHRFPKDPDRCARWVLHLRNASLLGISAQQLNHSYRVCSAHFHPSQFKRPSDVHAGLKWNAVPTMIDDPDPPPPPPASKLARKPPKTRQELPPKKRKKSDIVQQSGSSTADSVQRPSTPETDITSPDAPAGRPSPPEPSPAGLESADDTRVSAQNMFSMPSVRALQKLEDCCPAQDDAESAADGDCDARVASGGDETAHPPLAVTAGGLQSSSVLLEVTESRWTALWSSRPQSSTRTVCLQDQV